LFDLMTQKEELTEVGPWDFMAGKGNATLVQILQK
jgi:hypothetical protein